MLALKQAGRATELEPAPPRISDCNAREAIEKRGPSMPGLGPQARAWLKVAEAISHTQLV